MILMDSATASDEQLWRLACEGDREAFGRIVERYQSLVCSLAYSACGTLGTSEDMAQETFITAWHRLKNLREPGKLRQWLCGIGVTSRPMPFAANSGVVANRNPWMLSPANPPWRATRLRRRSRARKKRCCGEPSPRCPRATGNRWYCSIARKNPSLRLR